MTPGRLSIALCWLLDWLALGALASTGENLGWITAATATAGAGIAWSGARLASPRGIAWGGAVVIAGALVAGLMGLAPPLIVAAYAGPLIQAGLWLMPEDSRKTPLRLCLGLVELVVAAALSTEFHLFLIIFAYVVVGVVVASCHFLAFESIREASSGRMAPGATIGAAPDGDPLPRDFVPRMVGRSIVLFLCGLLIFPFLPRLKWGGRGIGGDETRIGYTEDVALTDRLKLSGSADSGAPVLWFYPRRVGVDLSEEIFLGLIRGRALGKFDGIRWSPVTPRPGGLMPHSASGGSGEPSRSPGLDRLVVDAIRDPLGNGVLPVPYGTYDVVGSNGIRPMRLGDAWVDSFGAGERGSYTFEFVPFHLGERGEGRLDPPLDEERYVPPSLRTERMDRLARSILGNAVSSREKADRVMRFFRSGGFSASLGDEDPGSTDNLVESSPAARRMHRLERFLFLDRRGFCELFASSTAVLLRLGGVPTRLIAGFRVTHGSVGGVLTVRSDDAHAWVEFWDPRRGWLPLDPTPRVLMTGGWLGAWRDGYDWVSGYWYRYILSFRWKPRGLSSSVIGGSRGAALSRLKRSWQGAAEWGVRHRVHLLAAVGSGIGGMVALYLLLLWRYPWILSIRHRVREGHPRLRRERRKMERWLSRRSPGVRSLLEEAGGPGARALQAWRSVYLGIRFGGGHRRAGTPRWAGVPSRTELRLLKERFQRVKALARPGSRQ